MAIVVSFFGSVRVREAASESHRSRKRIVFTGCVVRGRHCLIIVGHTRTLALTRDLNGSIVPGRTYRISGWYRPARRCRGTAGTIEPRAAVRGPRCRRGDARSGGTPSMATVSSEGVMATPLGMAPWRKRPAPARGAAAECPYRQNWDMWAPSPACSREGMAHAGRVPCGRRGFGHRRRHPLSPARRRGLRARPRRPARARSRSSSGPGWPTRSRSRAPCFAGTRPRSRAAPLRGGSRAPPRKPVSVHATTRTLARTHGRWTRSYGGQ